MTGDEDSVIGPISQGIVLNRWGKRRFMFDSSQSLHRGVMPARFKYFNEGAESWMWGYGLIDRDGNCIAMPSYSYVGGFSDGFAPVRIENSAGSYSSWLDVSGTVQFSSKSWTQLASTLRRDSSTHIMDSVAG